MKISQKFQAGGMAPAPVPAPEQGGGDPMQALIQGAAQAIQTQDCNVALQVCQLIVEMRQDSEGQAPQEEPVYRRGGKLPNGKTKIEKCPECAKKMK